MRTEGKAYRELEDVVREQGLPTPEGVLKEMAVGLAASEIRTSRALARILTVKADVDKGSDLSLEELRARVREEMENIVGELDMKEKTCLVISMHALSTILSKKADAVLMTDPTVAIALLMSGI